MDYLRVLFIQSKRRNWDEIIIKCNLKILGLFSITRQTSMNIQVTEVSMGGPLTIAKV
jgi:hypothetical protein